MKEVIRDSFWRYAAFRKEIDRAAAQAEELTVFHEWCKTMRYCGSNEYPLIDRIPEIQIRALQSFLDGMWQLTTDASSSRPSGGRAHEEPLIKWEDDEESGAGWEELLEAYIHSNSNE